MGSAPLSDTRTFNEQRLIVRLMLGSAVGPLLAALKDVFFYFLQCFVYLAAIVKFTELSVTINLSET